MSISINFSYLNVNKKLDRAVHKVYVSQRRFEKFNIVHNFLIQSDGDTKDLRSHGNPSTEGANLSEQKRYVL